MDRKTAWIICAVVMLAVIAVVVALAVRGSAAKTPADEVAVGLANPWSEAASAGEAALGAGLESFVLPEAINCLAEEYKGPALRYMDGLAEARYSDAENSLLLRKGLGDEDVSGDYNSYPEEWEINWKGLSVRCSGSGGEVRLARWAFGGCSYSLSFNSGDDALPGLSEEDVTSIVNQIQ